MTRLVLLIIFGIVAAFYFPDSRHVMVEKMRPALTPVFRWQTAHEMEEIARELQTYERENFGQLPQSRGFTRWLTQKFSDDVVTDSWGGRYTLVVERDSFAVLSWGPDGLPRTADDIRVTRPRARSGR